MQLVVTNGVTLILFLSPKIFRIIEEFANKLGLSLERHVIRDMVVEEKQKTALKDTLKGRKFIFKTTLQLETSSKLFCYKCSVYRQ